ncbi:MAG: cytochrome b/b6 domain-containing protein [Nitrospirota bacterium]
MVPLIVLTGLTMSSTIDTPFPWLLTIFGGRQAARTIHCIACFTFVGFIVVHVVEVILTGFFNNIRSMVTGWFVIKHEGKKLPASFSHRSGPQRTPVSTPPGLHSLRPC